MPALSGRRLLLIFGLAWLVRDVYVLACRPSFQQQNSKESEKKNLGSLTFAV